VSVGAGMHDRCGDLKSGTSHSAMGAIMNEDGHE
jgi:hypothetical protein